VHFRGQCQIYELKKPFEMTQIFCILHTVRCSKETRSAKEKASQCVTLSRTAY